MLSDNYVNLLEYTDKKNMSQLVQWNLVTYETININLNR
jgi:hypothetical protein